jgi:hypothetical protein
MKIHKSFVAWWFGTALCLEVAVAYLYFAGDWSCTNVLLVVARISFLGLIYRLLPGLLVAWAPSRASVTGEARDLAVFRGLAFVYSDFRYTQLSGTSTAIAGDSAQGSGAVLGPKKVVFAVRPTGQVADALRIPGPDVQTGPWNGDFVFDESNDAEQRLRQIGSSHKVKRVAPMPWLGFCVTETSLRGRVALLAQTSLLLLAYGACFAFQGYLCTTGA